MVAICDASNVNIDYTFDDILLVHIKTCFNFTQDKQTSSSISLNKIIHRIHMLQILYYTYQKGKTGVSNSNSYQLLNFYTERMSLNQVFFLHAFQLIHLKCDSLQ